MICYRDMTFCATGDCVFKSCERRLSSEVERLAGLSGMPIAITDFRSECQYYKKESCVTEDKEVE